MAQTQTSGVISTEPVKVDITAVDSALSEMWRKAAEGSVPGISTPLSRVLLLNLVVYAATDQEADTARDVITEISGTYPSRAVIADTEAIENESELGANVSMLCSIGERGRRLCGEEIRLHAHDNTAAVIGSVLPILAPDLPTYLWTPSTISKNGALRNLVDVSDYWIIDTRHTDSWSDTLALVESLGALTEDGIRLSDLAWSSVAHWQEIIAEQFDPPSARQYLPGISRIVIGYGKTDNLKPKSEAIMLVAWLMQRLKWQFKSISRDASDSWMIAVDSNGQSLEFMLKPSCASEVAITEVNIESQIDSKSGNFASRRVDNTDEIEINAEISDVPAVHRAVHSPPPTLSASLSRVLDIPGRDRLYYAAFGTIRLLMEQIESKV